MKLDIISDEFIVVVCDLKDSSSFINGKDDKQPTNLEDVANVIAELNYKLLSLFIDNCYVYQGMGDGYLGVFKWQFVRDAIETIHEILKIEEDLKDYVIENKLDINNKEISIGVSIDISNMIVFKERNYLVGRAINRAVKFSKKHKRDLLDDKLAITTTRFYNHIKKRYNIILNKHIEKADGVDVYIIDDTLYDKLP